MYRLSFEDGTVRIERDPDKKDPTASAPSVDPETFPGVTYDDRAGCHRAPAHRYPALLARFTTEGCHVEDRVLATDAFAIEGLTSTYELRSYQAAALRAWLETDPASEDASTDRSPADDMDTVEATESTLADAATGWRAPRGCLELPTGSGKTVIALKAIERLGAATLVVVPTIDLLEQWVGELTAEFAVPVGRLGGGEQRVTPVTVATYDSAYLRADEAGIGDRFGLVVFDEVHHLGGEGYREIATLLAAPARLGLTATFERPDGAHEVVADLVGSVVHRRSPDELAGEHLAAFDVRRLTVSLTPDERDRYDRAQETFAEYVATSGIEFRSGADYQKLVKRSGTDPRAREALLAREEARRVVQEADRKVDLLGELLDRHREDRVLVFAASTALVYEIARRYLVPAITHETPTEERRAILERFREGTYSRVVTANVLDEGVDVPDANVGIVLAGSGSEREFTQRLGRLLRPKTDGGRALLYEVITEATAEERTARRRRGGDES